jgi:hypothetical protein
VVKATFAISCCCMLTMIFFRPYPKRKAFQDRTTRPMNSLVVVLILVSAVMIW